MLANGGFDPGFTNEPGTSDEIEFAIDIGVYSIVGIDGTAGNQKIDFGQGAGALAGVSRINLNAGETTGIDSDVSITNVSSLWVDGNAGSDRIRAQGDKDRPRSAGAAGRYIRWIRQ